MLQKPQHKDLTYIGWVTRPEVNFRWATQTKTIPTHNVHTNVHVRSAQNLPSHSEADIRMSSRIIKSWECGCQARIRAELGDTGRRTMAKAQAQAPALSHFNDSFPWLDFLLKLWPLGTSTRKYALEDPQAEISGPSQSLGWKLKEERADPQPPPRHWTICLRRPGQMNVLKFYTNIQPKAFPGVCSGFNICIACLSRAQF